MGEQRFFETVFFVDVITMIDPDEMPVNIIRCFRQENLERAHRYFSNAVMEKMFADECMDELTIEFTLVTHDDGLLPVDCTIPLSK